MVLLYEWSTDIYSVVGRLSGAGEEERDEQEPPLHHGIEWGVEQGYGAYTLFVLGVSECCELRVLIVIQLMC